VTRSELEHAIRAACDIAEDTEIYIIGSQAILGEYPEAPEGLRQSSEADILPKNHPERMDEVEGVMGELSQFHETHGFYVHGVSPESAALPDGWENRLVKVQNANTRDCIGWCLEGHDLAASKLAAFREKDRDFVRILLAEGLVRANLLIRRIQLIPRSEQERERLVLWVKKTDQELKP